MLQQQHGLKVLLWSTVVDAIAPHAHKHQQPQQQTNSSSSRDSRPASRWLSGWPLASSSSSSSNPDAVAAGQPTATLAAADPVLLLKGIDMLLVDLQADLPLMYRCGVLTVRALCRVEPTNASRCHLGSPACCTPMQCVRGGVCGQQPAGGLQRPQPGGGCCCWLCCADGGARGPLWHHGGRAQPGSGKCRWGRVGGRRGLGVEGCRPVVAHATLSS